MGNLNKQNERALLIGLKKGEISSFDALYFRYSKKLMAFALTFFPNKELAEDAVQDIFIRIWERKAELDESKSFKTYLFQSVKYYMYNYARDRKSSCTFEEAPEHVFVNENQIENDLAYHDLEVIAFGYIEKLPKVQREIFKLNKLEGFSSAEIAGKMNLSQRTIEHHIYLASKTMKKELGAHISYSLPISFALLHTITIL